MLARFPPGTGTPYIKLSRKERRRAERTGVSVVAKLREKLKEPEKRVQWVDFKDRETFEMVREAVELLVEGLEW